MLLQGTQRGWNSKLGTIQAQVNARSPHIWQEQQHWFKPGHFPYSLLSLGISISGTYWHHPSPIQHWNSTVWSTLRLGGFVVLRAVAWQGTSPSWPNSEQSRVLGSRQEGDLESRKLQRASDILCKARAASSCLPSKMDPARHQGWHFTGQKWFLTHSLLPGPSRHPWPHLPPAQGEGLGSCVEVSVRSNPTADKLSAKIEQLCSTVRQESRCAG